jgi:hypothetical protein
MENAAVSINVWGFFPPLTHQPAGRCLNNTQNNPPRKHSLCVYITNPACRNARRLVWVVFLLFHFCFVCLFVFTKKKKRIAKVVGNDLTLPMSAKCGFFTASLGLFFDELLCTRVIKTHLTFSLFISSFSSFSGYYYCGCWPPRSSLQPLM